MLKDVYIVQVSGYFGAYIHGRCPVISYAPADKFVDFCLGLREDFPDYRLRCVINAGIEEKVQQRINADKILAAKKIKSK